MHEYSASKKLGKKLYKEKRKNYKRYKLGLSVSVLMFVIIIFINIYLAVKVGNPVFLSEALIVGIGFDIIPLIIGLLAYAAAISGGREVLMNRIEEHCSATEDGFSLYYIPNPNETTEYEKISFRIKKENIEKIVDDNEHGRLAVFGTYKTLKYKKKDDQIPAESYTVSDIPIYIYGYYEEFDVLKEELLGCCGMASRRNG